MGAKDALFAGLSDGDRRCYIQVQRIRKAIDEPKVLDALMDVLSVPGKGLKKLSHEEKLDAIAKQLDHHQDSRTSEWHGSRIVDILASALWVADLSNKFIEKELFSDVRSESALLGPVARWLQQQQLDVHAEIPLGKKRVDVLGHRPPGWLGLRGSQFIAVELKNEIKEMERGVDQMTTYADYAHRVYLACTPALAAQYLEAHANSRGVKYWDAAVLDRKLEKLGFGLLLVEGESVHEHLRPKDNSVIAKNLEEVMAALNERTRVARP